MAIAALVTGILGLLASIIPFGLLLGVPLAIAAIVCGIIGMRRRIQRGLAIGGVVTGVLALLVSVAWVVGFVWLSDVGGAFLEGSEILEEGAAFGGGSVQQESPCAGESANAFDAAVQEGAISVYQVEACPDFADDFQFGIEMENTGADPMSVAVSVTALSGGQVVSDPGSQEVFLEPGQSGWVEVVTFDEWQPADQVEVQINQP